MDTVKLGQRQIFGMKNTNLMKRVAKYFEQTKNASQVVEYLVAILLRDALCVGDFSLESLTELIHQIFLTTTPNDTLRKHCVFFESFFSLEEWQNVVNRLFKNKNEYHQFTKETCLYQKFLEKKNREQSDPSEYQYTLISSFNDSNGKKHTWTLRNTKRIPKHLENETANVLKILTSLTVFQSPTARRFAEYLNFYSHEGRIDAQHKEIQEEELVSKETIEELTTSKALIENEKPQKQTVAASTPPYDNEVITKVESKSHLAEEALSNSPSKGEKTTVANNSSAKKAAEYLQKEDTSYLRYDKSKGKSHNGREKNKIDRNAKRSQGNSGKVGSKRNKNRKKRKKK